MQTSIKPFSLLKSLCVLGVFALGTAAAHAGNDDPCFEDGLKNSWTPPAPSIHVDHHGGRGWGHVEHDWHFNSQHHGWGGWGEHSGSGNGGNGGIGGVSPIPEPATDAMLLTGLMMLATLARRKSKARR